MALMVVAIHAFDITQHPGFLPFVLLEGVFRLAVPVFFVINGYYFFHALENDKVGAWLKKVVVLYLFWSLLYLPSYLPMRHHALHWEDINIIQMGTFLIFGYMQLWYVSTMLFAACLIALLRKLTMLQALLLPLAVGLYVIGAAIQYGVYYNNLVVTEWPYRNFLFFAMPMLLAGYLIKKYEGSRPSAATLRNAALAGVALFMLETVCAWLHLPRDRGFDMYFSLLILAPVIFILLKNSRLSYRGTQLSTMSAMIYFSHYLLISIGERYLKLQPGLGMFLLAAGGSAVLGCCALYVPQRYRIFV